jgi:hypothetical protein
MDDDIELFLLFKRATRLLQGVIPRIEIQSEYRYANVVREHLYYFQYLSRFLQESNNVIVLADRNTLDATVPEATAIMRQKLPQIEILAHNRQWHGMLGETYDFLGQPSTQQILAIGPLHGEPPSKPPKTPPPPPDKD